MKGLREKIKSLSWFDVSIQMVLGLIILYIPMQYRYHKWIKPLANLMARDSSQMPLYFEKMVFYSISDVFILLLIALLLIKRSMYFSHCFFKGSAKYLSLFFSISLLSLFLSKNSDYLLQYFRLGQLMWVAMLFYLIASGSLVKDSQRAITAFFTLFSASSLFQCFVAIYQYFTQHALGLKKLGEMSLGSPQLTPSSISMHDGSLWVFDHLFAPGPYRVIARAYGTLPDPNILGGVLVLALMGLFYLYLKVELRAHRALIAVAIAIECFTLFITYSRSAYFGMVLGAALFLLLEGGRLYRSRAKEDHASVGKRSLKTLSWVILSSFILSFTLLYPQILSRGGYLNYKNTAAQGADQERKVYQEIAVDAIKENPLVGVGYNNYVLEMKEYSVDKLPEEFSHPVHNIFLLIASETGLLGLISFCAFVFGCGWSLVRCPSSSSRNILVSLYFVFGFIGCCGHYLLTWQQGKLMLFILLGLIALFVKTSRSKAKVQSSDVSQVTI